jgi:hypothetical protein
MGFAKALIISLLTGGSIGRDETPNNEESQQENRLRRGIGVRHVYDR